MAAKTTKAPAKGGKAAPVADQKDGASAPSTGAQDTAGIAPAAGAANEQATGNGDAPANNEGPAEPDGNGAGAGDSTGPANPAGAAAEGGTDAPTPGELTISGDSVNALTGEGANAPTGESANALDLAGPAGDPAGDGGSSELATSQTGESANAPTGEGANALDPAEPSAGAPTAEELSDLADSDDQETVQTLTENSPLEPVILGVWALPKITKFPATLILTNNTASRFVVQGKGIPVDGSIAMEVSEQQFSKLAKSLVSHVRLDDWDDVRGLQVAHESND
jgi:hypothetical protein